jgi:hypothetical protein
MIKSLGMNRRFFWLILFLVLLSLPGMAADSYWFKTKAKEWRESGKTSFLGGRVEAAVLDSLDALYGDTDYGYHFYSKGDKLFVLVSCTFDLYSVNGTILEKQYNYLNRGFTCATYPFGRDERHFLLGGKGFWTSQMDLLALDEMNGSWEWVKTNNQPIDYHSSYVYQNSKGVFTLFGNYYNPRKGIDAWEPQGYFLDWKTKTWSKVAIQIEGVDNQTLVAMSAIFSIETQDYVLLSTTSGKDNLGWNILEKESGKMYYFFARNADMAHSPVLEIMENELTYQLENGEYRTLDLDSIKEQSDIVGEVRVLEAIVVPKEVSPQLLYGLLIFALGGGFTWFFFSRRKKVVPVAQTPELREEMIASVDFEPIVRLLPYDGQQLTTDIIDQLLGIDHLENFDFKRMKRSRLIKEVNKRYLASAGKELVLRDKKPDDRRFTYYLIQA